MDNEEIHALEAQIGSDERDLQQMEKRAEELLVNIPHKGFAVATERAVLSDKIDALRESIRETKQRLAAARPLSR